MRLSFRIRRNYYDLIVIGLKTSEIRRASRFWTKRARRAMHELDIGAEVVAVFICGKRVHERKIKQIFRFDSAELALGREPSEQGRKDLGRGPVYKFLLVPYRDSLGD